MAKLCGISISKTESRADLMCDIADIDKLEDSCNYFLRSIGLSVLDVLDHRLTGRIDAVPRLFQVVCAMIDLFIVSYTAAHVEHLDISSEAQDHFNIAPELRLVQRTMECLDTSLMRPVWIFEVGAEAWAHPGDPRDSPLYLSKIAEELANIWGLVWLVKDKDGEDILRHNLGLGSIIKWP